MRWSVAVICLRRNIHLSQPAAFRLRNKQKRLSYVESAKTLGNGPSRASPAGASIACPSRPLGTKHERERRDQRGNAGTAGLGRPTASLLAGFRFRPQQRGLPAATDAASCTALKGSADRFCPSSSSEVATTARIGQCSGTGVPRIKQFLPSFHLAVISLMHPATEETLIMMCPALFLSRLSLSLSLPIRACSVAVAPDNRADGWYQTSPVLFHRNAAKIRAEIQKEQSCSWTVFPRQESKGENEAPAPSKKATEVCKRELEKRNSSLSGSWISAPTRTKDEETTPTSETRSVLPSGSVIQQNMTRLASIETGSRELQTAALPTTRSAATQTTNFTTDKGLVAAVAVHPRKILARASEAPALYSADHCAAPRPEPETARPSSDCRSRIRCISLDMNGGPPHFRIMELTLRSNPS